MLDPDWRIRYMNASMLEILRLIGRGEGVETLWDALPGWERSEPAGHLRHAMESGAGVCFRVDGERGRGRVWEVHAEPLDTGELRVRLRNVTALARHEAGERRHEQTGEPLAAREARLSSIVSAAPVGIVLMDADTLVVREANAFYPSSWRGTGGLPAPSWATRPATSSPSSGRRACATSSRAWRARGSVEIAESEFIGFERGRYLLPLDHAGGGRARGRPPRVPPPAGGGGHRAGGGAPRGRGRAARALRGARHAPRGRDRGRRAGGADRFINRAGVALGGRSHEELTAEDLAEYPSRWQVFRPTGEPFPPDELPVVRAIRGEVTRDVEILLRLPGGVERTVVASSAPLRDALGRVDRGMVVFYDLTERLALEGALLERTRDAESAAAEAALRAEESRTLREIGRTLVSEPEADRALELAARAAMELLGARAAMVAAPSPGGQILVHPALGSLAELDGRTFPRLSTLSAELLAGGPSRALNDLADAVEGTPLHELRAVYGVRSVALAPLRAFGVAMGVLIVADRHGGFGAEDLRLLEGLADSAALALHNARALAGERRRAEENRALLAAAEALTSTLDAAEVMQRIATIARDLAHADGAALTVLTGQGADERARVVAGLGVMESLIGVSSPAPNSLTRMVVDAHHAAAAATAELPDLYAGTREHLLRAGAAYLALVPVRAGGDDVGMLAVANVEAHGPFGDEQLRVVSLLADQAGLSVRNARLYQGAQAATRAQSEFLAMMSHELRTPLNALEGYAGLMEDELFGPLTDRQRDALRRMSVSRRHLIDLIDSVLDLARVEAGTRRAERQVVDVRALVESVGEAMSGAAVSKKLELAIDAAGVGRLCTDPGLLRQVLTNLLGNAIKFTERGGVALRAGAADGRVVVEVEDTGPGIAPEHLERVFERFFQVDPSMTRREGGTGLGLALSREFVHLLGGELTVRSEVGRGSVFAVSLPE